MARENLRHAAITEPGAWPRAFGQAVLGGLLPPRRPRVSTRKVKSPLSRWNKADPHRPRRGTPVTALTVTVSAPRQRLNPRHAQASA